jgi:hypothetical protein
MVFHSKAQIPAQLSRLVLERVNQVRDSMHVPPLTADPVLERAANMQAQWCKQHDTLSHYQNDNKRLYEPVDRVFAVGGHHDGIAENLLYRFPTAQQTPEEVAQLLVWQWVHSPGHFRNMIGATHRLSGLGFAWDPKRGRLYACQVFADSEWHPSAAIKIHPRAFGIRPRNDAACKGLDRFAGKEMEFAYGSVYRPPLPGQKTGTLTFLHRKAQLVKDMIGYPKGAIAGDIVFRNQFPCCSPNTLHGSPYHDGYLQKPRTWKWMSKRNIPDSLYPHQLHVVINWPAPLNPDSLQVNSVITKQRHFCRYGVPISIFMGRLGPFDFSLPPDTLPWHKVIPYRHRHLKFTVPFQKGNAVPDPRDVAPILDSLAQPGGEVVALRVKGFASIEGPLSINQGLMNERAQSIREIVQKQQREQVVMKTSAAENWHDFRRDLRGTAWQWLLQLPEARLRDTLQSDKTLKAAIEPILARHRYSMVEIDVRYALPDSMDNRQLADSLAIVVKQKRWVLAHRLQSEMVRRWMRKEMDGETVLAQQFPDIKECLPMIHNQLWLKERGNWNLAYGDQLIPLSRKYPWFLMRRTLHDTQQLVYGYSKKVNPPRVVWQNIQALKGLGVPADMILRLELNHYIATAKWGMSKGVPDPKVLDAIVERYAGLQGQAGEDSLSPNEAVKLGRFFNSIGGTGATVRFLKPYVADHADHADLVFLFAWTAALHHNLVPEEEWLGWMEKAYALDGERWMDQVNSDWQLLRWERVKALYCGCN